MTVDSNSTHPVCPGEYRGSIEKHAMPGAFARHRVRSKMRHVIQLLLELGVPVFTRLGRFSVRLVGGQQCNVARRLVVRDIRTDKS